MERVFSRGRLASLVFLFAIFIAVFILFGEKPNSAQERPAESPKATFEQFSRSDEITDAIRDRSRSLVRVQLRSIDERGSLSRYGYIVQDFGSSVVLSTDRRTDLSRLDVQRVETTINLPGKQFEPATDQPPTAIGPGDGTRSGKGYYIVQFGGIATDEWLDSIRDAGVEVLQYVPHQAFFVYGDGPALAKIAGHSRVRWVGSYTPEQKLSAHVSDFARGSEGEMAAFDVAVFSRADLDDVQTKLGGRLISRSKLSGNFFNVLRVELPKSDLTKVAELPDVFRVDPYIRPTAEDERAAQIVAGNYSSPTMLDPAGYNPASQFGADGTGVTVMVSDDGISIPGNGGFYITAGNTVDGPLRGATAGASGGHGHINASIIAGNTPFGILDPLGYNYGLGVAPKANIINIPFLKSGNTTTDAQAVDDTLNTLGPNGVRGTISNNSWGSGTNGNAYDSLAAQYDGFVRDGSFAATFDPFSIIFSAGNSGPGANSLTRPKVSKNTIAVANSENIRTELVPGNPTSADNMEDLRSTSSRGPAADGRVKPDVTAPGTVITGSRAGSCGSVTSCFDANHAYSSGTSHAAPQVAGAAALFTQHYRNGHLGESPRPSLIKAAIINSAQEMNGLTTNLLTIPNGNEGWGRMNMKFMMNTGVPMMYINEQHLFSNPGTGVAFLGSVGNSTKPVRITLVWTDPPGTTDPALVNNLDLQVNVNGTVYKGNVFSGGVSTTGGSGDTVNNVENVFIPAGIPAGSFVSVAVTAVALNGDGILGNADLTDQHFSVVAYNVLSEAPQSNSPVDFDGDGKTDISIFRTDMHRWWASRSSDGGIFATAFGAVTEPGSPLPADYTGDGKADVAVMRSDRLWFIQRSEDFTYYSVPFGSAADGDKAVPADYDGDGKTDIAIFRPLSATWYIQRSSGGVSIVPFGLAGDVPVPADYDGDGLADIAIFRPSNGQWWLKRTAAGVIAFEFATSSDKFVAGDYTGDGKADAAFWRPSDGFWYVLRSEDYSYYAVPFGSTGDAVVPGDYDGDGKFDTAVFRPSSATWYVNRSTAGILIQNFGIPSDTPLPSVFVP